MKESQEMEELLHLFINTARAKYMKQAVKNTV